MTIRDEIEVLNKLYSETGDDWVLSIRHMLTEPTCPTIVIRPESAYISRYRVDADSIEEGIKRCVALVKREVIDRHIIGSAAPYTESHDGLYEAWLKKRAAGSNEHLPEFPRLNEYPR